MLANLDAILPCGLQNKSQRKDTLKNFAVYKLSKKNAKLSNCLSRTDVKAKSIYCEFR